MRQLRTARAILVLFVFLLTVGAVRAASLPQYSLKPQDGAFLEDLSRRGFLNFQEQTDPNTGLVRDRALVDGSPVPGPWKDVGSIAATGFGLTATCIGAERGWISQEEARARVRTALYFFANRAHNEKGWFYHWMDVRTGERYGDSEISSIDTALLLGGILTARQCFADDQEIVRLSTQIYERVDFRWMLNGHAKLLSHGWRPEGGFIPYRWDSYSEHMILYLLAIGSPKYPIPADSWYAWSRDKISYEGFTYITGGPLFIHQYSHAWVDFRGRREKLEPGADYFENSVNATRAHRAFCMKLGERFTGYSSEIWGITASSSPKWYTVWGGPPSQVRIDGTVVPCAAGGSLMFTPDISLSALRAMHQKFGPRIYGRYGFADAFNPISGWVSPDVIGIDQGIMLLSAENLRSEGVWRWFMRNGEVIRGLELAGLG